MDFFDNPNVTVSNVTTTGNMNSVAFFDAGLTDLGLNAGIAFCNGEVASMVGPNQASGIGSNLGLPGDVDIDQMSAGLSSFDAVTIEFDFTVAVSETMNFNYVFGSEEYPEFAGSNFNDACLLYTSPSPRDQRGSRMPSSA